MEEDWQVTIKNIALANGDHLRLSIPSSSETLGLFRSLLGECLGFLIQTRNRRGCALASSFWQWSLPMFDNIVTVDESAFSFHTPETKQQSKQWLPKGQSGPIKAKAQDSRTMQMVPAFFDSKGIIYTTYVPGGPWRMPTGGRGLVQRDLQEEEASHGQGRMVLPLG
jgi:hypothetical protein